MEKMGRGIVSNSNRAKLNDILQRIVLGEISQTDQADIILLLNSTLRTSDISINTDFPEINSLLYVLSSIKYDNNVISILCSELKSRIIRESILPGPECNIDSNTVTNVHEKVVSKTAGDRVTPVNGNFKLPPPGQTAIIYSKNDIPGSKLREVERIEIDHEGNVLRVLDRYKEHNRNAIVDEEDLVYTGLLDDVLSFDDLHEDMKEEASSDKSGSCDGNCDGCKDPETDN